MQFKGNWVLRIFCVWSVVQYPIFIQNAQCGASENVAKNCRKEGKNTVAKTRKSKLWIGEQKKREKKQAHYLSVNARKC